MGDSRAQRTEKSLQRIERVRGEEGGARAVSRLVRDRVRRRNAGGARERKDDGCDFRSAQSRGDGDRRQGALQLGIASRHRVRADLGDRDWQGGHARASSRRAREDSSVAGG